MCIKFQSMLIVIKMLRELGLGSAVGMCVCVCALVCDQVASLEWQTWKYSMTELLNVSQPFWFATLISFRKQCLNHQNGMNSLVMPRHDRMRIIENYHFLSNRQRRSNSERRLTVYSHISFLFFFHSNGECQRNGNRKSHLKSLIIFIQKINTRILTNYK